MQLLTNTRGQPWTKCGFKASWQKALRGPLAPIREAGLVFHGLRKSAVVTLLEAGCTTSRGAGDHRAVDANGRALREAGEPEEAGSLRDLEVGERAMNRVCTTAPLTLYNALGQTALTA